MVPKFQSRCVGQLKQDLLVKHHAASCESDLTARLCCDREGKLVGRGMSQRDIFKAGADSWG